MAKSSGPDTVFFDIGLPALKGLAVNEKTDEFIVVDTCPGMENVRYIVMR